MKSKYKYHKKWRLRNVKARNKDRLTYYKKHRKYNLRGGKRYSIYEQSLIMSKIHNGEACTDIQIAMILHRSVQAIQIARAKLHAKQKVEADKNRGEYGKVK